MDALPSERRRERWPQVPAPGVPQDRACGPRGQSVPGASEGCARERLSTGTWHGQDHARPTVKVNPRTGGTCGGLAQPKGTGRSWEGRESAAAGALSSGLGLRRRGTGEPRGCLAEEATAVAAASPVRALPRAAAPRRRQLRPRPPDLRPAPRALRRPGGRFWLDPVAASGARSRVG